MVDYNKVFEALPNVKTIWLTDDGHFHLHPHNGGEKVERGELLEPIKPIEANLHTDQPDTKLAPASPDTKPRSKGRPKRN